MKQKFNDIGRCLVCLKNPCECKKDQKQSWEERWKRFYREQVGFEKHFPNLSEELWIKFISQEIQKAREEERKEWTDKVTAYKNYFTTIGDKINEGRVMACEDLIKELNK
jgi:hypothetical protein